MLPFSTHTCRCHLQRLNLSSELGGGALPGSEPALLAGSDEASTPLYELPDLLYACLYFFVAFVMFV